MIKFLKYVLILTTILFEAELAKANDYERAYEALAAEDYKTAVYYLSFFASNGDARSQYNMGIIYRDGQAMKKLQCSVGLVFTRSGTKTRAGKLRSWPFVA